MSCTKWVLLPASRGSFSDRQEQLGPDMHLIDSRCIHAKGSFFTGRKYRKIFNTQLFIVEGVSWTKVGRIKEMSRIPTVSAGHCPPAGVELDVNQTKANIHHIPLSSEVVRGSGGNPNGLKGRRRWAFSSIPLPETANVQTGVDQSSRELIPLSPPQKKHPRPEKSFWRNVQTTGQAAWACFTHLQVKKKKKKSRII